MQDALKKYRRMAKVYKGETLMKKGNGIKYSNCPHCGRKGLHKNSHKERCRYCGLKRVLLPGQDF